MARKMSAFPRTVLHAHTAQAKEVARTDTSETDSEFPCYHTEQQFAEQLRP